MFADFVNKPHSDSENMHIKSNIIYIIKEMPQRGNKYTSDNLGFYPIIFPNLNKICGTMK